MIKTIFILSITCLLSSGCSLFILTPPPAQKAVTVIVFCDMSSSLTERDTSKLIETAADAVNIMKTGGKLAYNREVTIEYYLVPWADRATDLITEYVYKPSKNVADSKNKYNQALNDLSNKRELIANSLKQASMIFSNNRSTCLITSIRQGASRMNNLATNNDNNIYELVYVSDMLESCSYRDAIGNCTTEQPDLLSTRLSLEKGDIKDETRSITGLICPDLDMAKRINVSIIMPSLSIGDDSLKTRPTEANLLQFWQKVFTKYGFMVDNRDSFSFGYDYPARFRN